MARSEAKRRKQLEKKKQKRNQKKHELIRQHSAGLGEKLQQRATAPVHECLIGESLTSQGIGHVVISRKAASGEYALACFLVDRYCMGVKDCFGVICSGAEYRERLERLRQRLTLRRIDASTARRAVEDAVAYAHDLGLSPHRHYRAVRQIFGNIDPAQATEFLEMGKDGKPLFMPGPHQTAEETRMIMAKLSQAKGPGKFDFILPAGAPARGFDDMYEDVYLEGDADDFRVPELAEDR